MRKNEPDAAKRVAGPIPFYDADGELLKNQTFDNGSGEVFTYRSSTNDWVAAAADTTELGGANETGMYLLQLSQGETNFDSIVGVKLVKAGLEDQYWFERIDNTPDVNVVSESLGLARALGLLHENAVVDNQTWSGTDLLTARLRVFADEVDAAAAVTGAADDADGETQRYLITIEYSLPGKPERYQLVRDL